MTTVAAIRTHVPRILAFFLAFSVASAWAQDDSRNVPAPPAPTAPALPSAPAAEAAPPAPPAPPVATPPALARQSVSTSGCSVLAPSGLEVSPPEKSPDGADVWTSEVSSGDFRFSAVVVKLVESFGPGEGDNEEALLVSYLAFLKDQFKIAESAGVTGGQTLSAYPGARGALDHWKENDGTHWSVKGWADQSHLGVLFLYGPSDYPYPAVEQTFLDGFRCE